MWDPASQLPHHNLVSTWKEELLIYYLHVLLKVVALPVLITESDWAGVSPISGTDDVGSAPPSDNRATVLVADWFKAGANMLVADWFNVLVADWFNVLVADWFKSGANVLVADWFKVGANMLVADWFKAGANVLVADWFKTGAKVISSSVDVPISEFRKWNCAFQVKWSEKIWHCGPNHGRQKLALKWLWVFTYRLLVSLNMD